MKYFLTIILLIALDQSLLFSQPGRAVRVKAGEDIAQTYLPNGFYLFPQFRDAAIYFKEGERGSGILFNFNILSGNMQFINPAGDTLEMDPNPVIDSIVFKKNVFCYHDRFMEVVAQAGSIKLLKKINIKIRPVNVGGFGETNSTVSILHVSDFYSRGSVRNLIINQDAVIIEDISWFFMNGNNEPVKSSKANLIKLLPHEKKNVTENYLKNNKISFEKEVDLKKLIDAIAAESVPA